mgnify:FL=1
MVKDTVNALVNAVRGMQGSTGWAEYKHGGGAQALAAGARTKLVVDAAEKIESQLPVDTGPLWNTANNTIKGRAGDAILVKIQCTFTPDDATASQVDFDVDIGGAIGKVEEQVYSVTGGAGVPALVSYTFLAYMLGTWAANGGSIYATADGPGVVTNLRVVLAVVHRAR